MQGVDYYLTHSVHPSLWAGCRGAWLPSLGNTGFKIPCQVGISSSCVAFTVGATQNNHSWAKNSSSRGGEQIVAQGISGISYWRVPFPIGVVRQASISCWVGARGTATNGVSSATSSARYILAWWSGSNTAFGIIQNSANGGFWLDGAWRGTANTVWPQSLTHYCLTWGPGRLLTVYQNGVSIHSHTMSGSAPSGATDPQSIDLGNGFGGSGGAQWDDLRVYHRALSPREVALLAERPGVAYQTTPRRRGFSTTSGQTVSPVGVASTLDIGEPTITTGDVTVSATGIASTLDPGEPTVTTGAVTVSLTGIASALDPGEPTITTGDATVSPTGIPSALDPGEPTVTAGDVTVSATGIGSTLDIGEPDITSGLSVVLTGIASTLDIGEPTITTGDVTVSLTGIPTAIDIGEPTISADASSVSLVGIASTLDIGEPTITTGGATVVATAIASTLDIGEPTITTGAVTVSLTGVASTIDMGEPSVSFAGAAQNIVASGIGSTLDIGEPTIAFGSVLSLVSRSTMTLENGLYNYLTDPIPYIGHAEKPFKRVKTLDGITIRNRNDARRELQSRIAKRVYLDRRPQDAEDDACIVIRHVTATHDYGLAGETDGVQTFIQATVYASGADAARRGGTIYGLLQLCVSGYHEGYWGDVLIGEATIDGGRSLAYSPADNSDKWTFTRQMDLVVYYYSASVPEYSDWPLTAIPNVTVTSTELRLALGSSLIPEGGTLVNAGWMVQATPSGPLLASFGGNPNQLVNVAGVTGTNAEPVISRSTFNTIPNTPYVTLILTDSSGDTHAKGVQVDG